MWIQGDGEKGSSTNGWGVKGDYNLKLAPVWIRVDESGRAEWIHYPQSCIFPVLCHRDQSNFFYLQGHTAEIKCFILSWIWTERESCKIFGTIWFWRYQWFDFCQGLSKFFTKICWCYPNNRTEPILPLGTEGFGSLTEFKSEGLIAPNLDKKINQPSAVKQIALKLNRNCHHTRHNNNTARLDATKCFLFHHPTKIGLFLKTFKSLNQFYFNSFFYPF